MDAFYYDISHPAGYASIAKLATAVKTSRKKALDYLQRQNTYTIHKPTRKNSRDGGYWLIMLTNCGKRTYRTCKVFQDTIKVTNIFWS